MIYVFCFFAVVLVFLSYKSFRGGIAYLSFFKRELAKPPSDFAPFASVIVPCRGLDEGLEENLSALVRQYYFNDYEVIFAVDSPSDAAVPVIEKVIERRNFGISGTIAAPRYVCRAKLFVAGKTENESQKVHNLRESVTQVSGESQIFVFADSDARPSENWLCALVAPLRDEKIGAATGYRWFISKKFGFASELRSVWNASIASALGANTKNNFCWGGSMALRRETFEKLAMRERWKGTLSDDFAVTRAMKAANLEIFFVPQALIASIENCTWRELFEFTTRQMKITRVYAENLWIQSFIGAGLFNLVWLWGIFNLFFYSFYSSAFWFSLAALVLISIFSVGKAHLRLKAVKAVLKDYENELEKQFWTQNTLWIFSPALFFCNAFAALVSRKIIWRGTSYELKSPTETVVINSDTTDKGLSSSDVLD